MTGTNLVKTIPLIGNALYTSLVGGTQPGPATLIRFYAWHIFGLTLAAGILVVWHIFRVRRDGGIAVPPPPCARIKPASPASSWCGVKCWRCCWLAAGCCCWPLSLRRPLAAPINPSCSRSGDGTRPLVLPVGAADAQAGQPFLVGGGRSAGRAAALFPHPLHFPKTCQGRTGTLVPERQPSRPGGDDPRPAGDDRS